MVGTMYLAVLGIYVVMQLFYSFGLKRIFLLDVFIIAIGFVLRALAGAAAVEVRISGWLVLCTFMLALFLGLCKRRAEKGVTSESDAATNVVGHRAVLSRYSISALDQFVVISGAATIVCYAIYTLASETVAKFGTSALAGTVPFVMFGIFRYMHLVHYEKRGERPEKILVTDVPLILTIFGYVLAVLAAFAWTQRGVLV
jgi:4-hydroxybenzoate polyprenyltransferase